MPLISSKGPNHQNIQKLPSMGRLVQSLFSFTPKGDEPLLTTSLFMMRHTGTTFSTMGDSSAPTASLICEHSSFVHILVGGCLETQRYMLHCQQWLITTQLHASIKICFGDASTSTTKHKNYLIGVWVWGQY